MTRVMPGPKEMVAFKIGARARKFLLEGCPVEGYEILMTAIAEAKSTDSVMHELLQAELQKFEKRLAAVNNEED